MRKTVIVKHSTLVDGKWVAIEKEVAVRPLAEWAAEMKAKLKKCNQLHERAATGVVADFAGARRRG